MGYLDKAGLAYFWEKVKTALSGKQDTIASGDGIDITETEAGPKIGVTAPVQGIVTQAEFDALPEEQQNKGLYAISDGMKIVIGGEAVEIPGGGGVPAGVIVIWSGTASDIPDGWALCDGQDGRPDLRDRFVLGGGGTHTVGETGGEEMHKLIYDELPSHAHVFSYRKAPCEPGMSVCMGGTGEFGYQSTNASGGSQPHNNMPPYYVLCYIIKL